MEASVGVYDQPTIVQYDHLLTTYDFFQFKNEIHTRWQRQHDLLWPPSRNYFANSWQALMTSGRFLSAGHRLAHTPQSSSCTRPSSKYRLTMPLEVDQWILSASAIVKSSCSGSSNALTKKLAGFLNNFLPSSLRHVQVLNCVHACSLGPEASHLFKASWTMHTLRLSNSLSARTLSTYVILLCLFEVNDTTVYYYWSIYRCNLLKSLLCD